MIDYHIHTSLCNHAEGTMAAYIRSAIDKGLKEICFLDHLTFTKQGRSLSMTPGEVPMYVYRVQHYKRKFKGIIQIKTGLEVDFNPEYTKIVEQIINQYAFDVVGSSVHFAGDWNIVSRQADRENKKLEFDRIYALYLDYLEKMLDYHYFDIVCHLDIIKKFNRRATLECEEKLADKFDKIISKISYHDLTVEINTSGFDHPVKEVYPSERLLKKCLEKGVCVTIGSDAHHPKSVGQHFDKATKIAYSAGCRALAAFTERNRYEIPLESYHAQ